MREGEDRRIIYLNTRAELGIAREAFQAPIGEVLDESIEARRAEAADRLYEARGAEFGVLANDVGFLLNATHKILAERKVMERTLDTIRGRRSAAKRISDRLSNRVFAYPVPISNTD